MYVMASKSNDKYFEIKHRSTLAFYQVSSNLCLHNIFYTICTNFDVDKTDAPCIIILYYDLERSSSKKIRIRATSKSSKTIKPLPLIPIRYD